MIFDGFCLDLSSFSLADHGWEIPGGVMNRREAAAALDVSPGTMTRWCDRLHCPKKAAVSLEEFTVLFLGSCLSALMGGGVVEGVETLRLAPAESLKALSLQGIGYRQYLALLEYHQETGMPIRSNPRQHGGRPKLQAKEVVLTRGQACQILGVSHVSLRSALNKIGIHRLPITRSRWLNIYALYSSAQTLKRDRVYGAFAKVSQWLAEGDPALDALSLRAERYGWGEARAIALFECATGGETIPERWDIIT